MKKSLLHTLILFLFTTLSFSQLMQKEIDVVKTKDIEIYHSSFELFGYGTTHFGEREKSYSVGASGYYFQYYPSRLFLKFGAGFGDVKFFDANGQELNNEFYGGEFMAGLFLFNQVDYHKKSLKINPYLGFGLNGIRSKANHYISQTRVDIGFSGAIGLDFKLSSSVQAGVHLNASYILSDALDDVEISSQKDVLFRPGITLKYIFGKANYTETYNDKELISYKPTKRQEIQYEKYKEETIEPFIEISISQDLNNQTFLKEDTINDKNDNLNSPISQSANKSQFSKQNEHLNIFYTIQISSLPNQAIENELNFGVEHDFIFYNDDLNLYNYMKGFYESSNEAFNDLKKIQQYVPDAFVTSIYKNKRLSVFKAKKILDKNPELINIPISKKVFNFHN